jgi:DNA-binding LytR/AlgR family response regulator
MIRCIALDDEPLALQLIKRYIEKTPFLKLEGAYNNPIEALEQVQKHKIQLIFLDINMPDLNGMQLSRLLPDFCKVIFTTAYEEYALESYRVAAIDYLVKPFSYEEFLPAATKAKDFFNQKDETSEQADFIFIKADYKLHKVYFKSILFVENIKDYVRLHLNDGTKLMSLMSLKSLEETLPSNFMKVHRSFIVNKDAITTIERSRIVFGNHYVPIADSHKEAFQQYLSGKSVE